jgi:MFS family permease
MQSSSLKQLWVLMAIVFVDMIGFLMVVPMVPYYATRLGARPLVVGLILSAFSCAQLVSAPLWGRFSDRYGRRPALLIGLFSSSVAFVLFGLANTIALLFLFRLVQGAGGGTTGVVQAYVSESVPPEQRAEALGWISAASNAGVMIGPLVGLATRHLGTWGPGYVAAGLCALNALAAWRWLPESRRLDDSPIAGAPVRLRQPIRRSVLLVLRHPAAPISAVIWIYAIGMLAQNGMNGVLALYLGKVYAVTDFTIPWVYSYIGAIGIVMRAILLGPMVRRVGEIGVTRLGSLSLVLGLALIPIPALLDLTRPERLVMLALIILFVPVGTALLFPATTALVSHRTARVEMGQTMGVQQAFGSMARVVGPICATKIYELDIRAPFWAAAAVMLATSFLTSRLTGAEPEKLTVAEAPATDRA